MAGGDISECGLVEGEVCSLQLTHKNMSSNIVKPRFVLFHFLTFVYDNFFRIALVSESIMFKDRNTMVSLETVSLQVRS